MAKIPNVNPFIASAAFCSNRKCGELMQPKLSDKNGESMIIHTCEKCGYYCESSPAHINGQCRPVGQKAVLKEAMTA
jgi:hypothetical protein